MIEGYVEILLTTKLVNSSSCLFPVSSRSSLTGSHSVSSRHDFLQPESILILPQVNISFDSPLSLLYVLCIHTLPVSTSGLNSLTLVTSVKVGFRLAGDEEAVYPLGVSSLPPLMSIDLYFLTASFQAHRARPPTSVGYCWSCVSFPAGLAQRPTRAVTFS